MFIQKDFFPFGTGKGPLQFHVNTKIASDKVINYSWSEFWMWTSNDVKCGILIEEIIVI